jgi:hypothetical protein
MGPDGIVDLTIEEHDLGKKGEVPPAQRVEAVLARLRRE